MQHALADGRLILADAYDLAVSVVQGGERPALLGAVSAAGSSITALRNARHPS